MQKLIKLSDTHYIVVDDSEIKVGDWCYSVSNGLIVEPNKKAIDTINSKPMEGIKFLKITHSTQPLEVEPIHDEKFPKVFDKIKRLSLSEVEEAINGCSIYQKALDFAITSKIYIDDEKTHDEVAESLTHYIIQIKPSFTKICDILTNQVFNINEIKLLLNNWAFGVSGSAKPHIKDYIQSLLPKEWDVTFDEQGKIKLV